MTVLHLQLNCNCCCLLFISRRKQTNASFGIPHTPTGIQPWCKPETDKATGYLTLKVISGTFQQFAKSHIGRVFHPLKSFTDNDPVFIIQWYDICHCADSRKLQVFCNIRLIISVSFQPLYQFIGHTASRQIKEGIAFSRLFCIHNSHSLRQLLLAFMMIRNNHIHRQ